MISRLFRKIVAVVRALPLRFLRAMDPVKYARAIGVHVGRGCRLIDVDFGSEPYLVSLGDHVSATATQFITHDGGVWVFREERPDLDLIAPIRVGNNVFLGYGVIVLPGVTIGDNVVIGAGAVVTRDIPPNCVAVGVPARPIRTLDEYRTAVERRAVPTKRMNAGRKREYLMKRFGRSQ